MLLLKSKSKLLLYLIIQVNYLKIGFMAFVVTKFICAIAKLLLDYC